MKSRRLTIKNEFGNYIGSNLLDDECLCRDLKFDELNEMTACFNKLGQLEDILEKYGIESLYELDKKLRLLELIKAKQVNVYYFTFYTKGRKHFDYEDYSKTFDLPGEEGCCDTLEVQQFTDGTKLIEDEFNLMMEELK